MLTEWRNNNEKMAIRQDSCLRLTRLLIFLLAFWGKLRVKLMIPIVLTIISSALKTVTTLMKLK
jgi:hypothetical protein